MKIGFIGAGNMAGAMVHGMLASGYVEAQNVFIYDVAQSAVDGLTSTLSVQGCDTAAEVVAAADTIIFAVKPQVIGVVVGELAPLLRDGKKMVISIAAGVTLSSLASYIQGGEKTPIIRVMPNVNMLVGQATSAVCANAIATEAQVAEVLNLFRSMGQAVYLPEKDISIFTAIAGCSPAYVALFIDSMSRAAVKHGLSKSVATEIATGAVLGTARMLAESNKTPWELIDMVCSPAGTTVAGLLEMQEYGFQTSIVRGIDAAVARDAGLQHQT